MKLIFHARTHINITVADLTYTVYKIYKSFYAHNPLENNQFLY